MARKEHGTERFREFLAEAEDILNTMGKDIAKLGRGVKAGVIDPAVLNSIFRSAHTLKGISGIFDLHEMAGLSHAVEDTLDALRLGRVDLTPELLDCVMGAHDLLLRILATRGDAGAAVEVAGMKARLASASLAAKERPRTPAGGEFLSVLTEYEAHRLRENIKGGRTVFVVTARFPLTSFDKGYSALTEALKASSEIIATLPSTSSGGDEIAFEILVGTDRTRDEVGSIASASASVAVRSLADGEKGPDARPEGAGALGRMETVRRPADTVRVPIDKLDGIMGIVSELGVLKSSVTRLAAEFRTMPKLSVYGMELTRIERRLEKKFAELRDGILGVRMVPIGRIFSRFDTFLARLERESGREIRLELNGGDTEVDKLVAEELADPLLHLIRNAVDHAIEPPEEREAAGKPRAGVIALAAYQKGNNVVIEVEDDGRGVDVDLVRQRAASRGIVARETAGVMTRHDALGLIFMPGFSTKDAVSLTSGRGVGLDVVKENITRLSGIIDVFTEKGKGTRFVLTIPATQAIMRVLIVEDAGRRYAVPLNSVIEIMDLASPGDGAEAGGLARSGEAYSGARMPPSIRVSGFFASPAQAAPPRYGIVAGLAEHRICLLVDALAEEEDVVVKPLPRLIDKTPGIAGAADLGEEGTILVLDVPAVLDSWLREKGAITVQEQLPLGGEG